MPNAIPLHLLHRTQRAEGISRLRAYAKSEQYKGRPDFWTGQDKDGKTVPLRERAPCVIYPLPKIATNRVVDFCFGETRFPALSVPTAKDGAAIYNLSISEQDAETLTNGIADLVKHANVRSTLVRMMRRGLQERTAVAIFSIRDGQFAVELPSPDHCQPTFVGDDPARELVALSWVYQYDEEFYDEKLLCVATRRMWFRRDIDAIAVTEYEPVKCDIDDRKAPEWKAKPPVPHGFGFCPALWVRNVPAECSHLDGQALLEGNLNECDALNFAYSQRHRGVVFFGTPQPWETGVVEDDGPEATVRTAKGYSPDDKPAPYGAMAPKPARATAPDRIWSYEGEGVKLGLLETTGAAFKVATEHVNDIRQRISEATSIVLADPDAAKGMGDLNAKLLAMLYAPMLSLVDTLRDETWWPALQSVISTMLRMLVAVNGVGVLLPNAAKLATLLKRFAVTTADTKSRWVCPPLEAVWGDSFAPSNTEIGEGIRAANDAKEAGLITTKTAAAFVGSYFGVTKPDQEVDEAAKEADERAAKAQAAFEQNNVDPTEDDDTPPGTEPRAPQTQE